MFSLCDNEPSIFPSFLLRCLFKMKFVGYFKFGSDTRPKLHQGRSLLYYLVLSKIPTQLLLQVPGHLIFRCKETVHTVIWAGRSD